MVDAVEPQAPVALATGAPIFWSWQPGGRQLAMRQTPSDGGGPLVTLSDPLGDPHAPPVELAAAGTFYVPAWSPDGSQIAFDSDRSGDLAIYLMDMDGSNQTKIADSSSADYYPAWSSDGRRISFTSNRNDRPQVYVMEADGSDPKAVTSGDSWSSAASWKPENP